jgi:hypothetical protein
MATRADGSLAIAVKQKTGTIQKSKQSGSTPPLARGFIVHKLRVSLASGNGSKGGHTPSPPQILLR